MGIEYLDPSIANEGISVDNWNPGDWTHGASLEGEEYQPEFEAPHINDYAALKKHKQYAKYFRPYRYIPFPAVLYHKTLGEKIVNSEAEVIALGPEWHRQPFARKIDMTGKSVPGKSDTQRLTEALVENLSSKPGVDPTAIAGIVAAVMAAMQKPQAAPPQESHDPEPQHGDERHELIRLALEKGIKVDGRWSTERIKEAIGLE